MIKAQLINVGRGKVNRSVEVKDAQQLFREIEKRLMSRDVEIAPVEADETLYNVYSGFHKVGEVRITEG